MKLTTRARAAGLKLRADRNIKPGRRFGIEGASAYLDGYFGTRLRWVRANTAVAGLKHDPDGGATLILPQERTADEDRAVVGLVGCWLIGATWDSAPSEELAAAQAAFADALCNGEEVKP